MPCMTLEGSYEPDCRIRLTTGPVDEDGALLYALVIQQGREHLGPNLQVCGLTRAHVQALRDACNAALGERTMPVQPLPLEIMADT